MIGPFLRTPTPVISRLLSFGRKDNPVDESAIDERTALGRRRHVSATSSCLNTMMVIEIDVDGEFEFEVSC